MTQFDYVTTWRIAVALGGNAAAKQTEADADVAVANDGDGQEEESHHDERLVDDLHLVVPGGPT